MEKKFNFVEIVQISLDIEYVANQRNEINVSVLQNEKYIY